MSKMVKSRQKICFVLTAEFAVKVFLLNHLRALSEFYDVTVIVNTNNPNFLEERDVKAKVVPLTIARDINIISDFICLIQLIKIFRQQKFSAVHSLMPKSGLLAMLAAWIVRAPLRVHTFTGQVWVTKIGFKRYLLKKIDVLIACLSMHVIVDSFSQQQFLIKEKVIIEEKSIVFANGSISGVNIGNFKSNLQERFNIRVQLGIANDALVYLFIGRLNTDKGVLNLAKAWREANIKGAYLLFVGPDEQQLKKAIMSILASADLSVRFIGYTDTPQSYMAAADVLCLPSYREGFGSVVIEAAAVGIPAIASRIYGITDAVVEGETGLLHVASDVEGIKKCIQMLASDESLRLKLGDQAKIRAIRDFDSRLVTNAWVNFYSENTHGL
jgi:glycosyltransferase involved in cell wall biosynthesis